MSDQCTEVTAICTVQESIYGYYPSLAANSFFLAFFALFFIFNLGLGVRYKTWTYMSAMLLGTLAESIGYVGRIMLHSNPYNNTGFIMQICCIVIGPAFNSAAIYITLKHVVLTFGPEWSRIQPALYTYIFISCDLISLILQAIGGAMASTANNDLSQLNLGDNLSIAGISWQVAVLFFFGVMTADYVFRRARATKTAPLTTSAQSVADDRKFRAFAVAITTAYSAIFIRCIYRIAEFAGGWQNPIMQNEGLFIALEGAMIAIATFAQTIFHPGFCFPQISSHKRPTQGDDLEKKTSNSVR
jgi:hypothetical protein